MRLLYFAPHQIWPLTTGARLRDYHLARQLAMKTELTLVEMRHPNDEDRMPPADAGFARIITLNRGRSYTPVNVLRGMVGTTPLSLLNYYSSQLAAELAAALETHRFDAVQLESVHLMKFLPVIRQAAGSPAILID